MMKKYWEIEGLENHQLFYRRAFELFPDATTFYAEGITIDLEVKNLFMRHIQDGSFLPGANTIFPVSEKFRCEFSGDLFFKLQELSNTRNYNEVLDHLFIYNGPEPLLEWHDAFENSLLISRSLDVNRIESIASTFGLPYCEVKLG